MMRLIVEKGNLFELDKKYALAHCISLDCEMGAGIAVEFGKRFKDIKRDLLKCTKSGNKIATVLWYDEIGRVVFNLITKAKYWHKPTYESITDAIMLMAEMCKNHDIKYLAMPKIGCGLDRLKWDKVVEIIEAEFKDLDIEIVVRYL